MRSVNQNMGRAMRRSLLAIAASAWLAPALAGGPLFVVPSGGTLKPARWEGTVKVYTDQGTLGTLDNAKANQLVANAVTQWSSVPTSSFRAVIAGQLPFDVTGANAGQVIGASNGGGIQVIYDSDGSVIGDFMGAGPGVLGIASPEYLAGPDSNQIVEGWVIRSDKRTERIPYAELGKMSFTASAQAKGHVTLGDKKIIANGIALHTHAIKDSELPVVREDEIW